MNATRLTGIAIVLVGLAMTLNKLVLPADVPPANSDISDIVSVFGMVVTFAGLAMIRLSKSRRS